MARSPQAPHHLGIDIGPVAYQPPGKFQLIVLGRRHEGGPSRGGDGIHHSAPLFLWHSCEARIRHLNLSPLCKEHEDVGAPDVGEGGVGTRLEEEAHGRLVVDDGCVEEKGEVRVFPELKGVWPPDVLTYRYQDTEILSLLDGVEEFSLGSAPHILCRHLDGVGHPLDSLYPGYFGMSYSLVNLYWLNDLSRG